MLGKGRECWGRVAKAGKGRTRWGRVTNAREGREYSGGRGHKWGGLGWMETRAGGLVWMMNAWGHKCWAAHPSLGMPSGRGLVVHQEKPFMP